MKTLLLTIIGSLLWTLTFSQIRTDRPSQSYGSSTVDKGTFQVEVGLQFDQSSFITDGYYSSGSPWLSYYESTIEDRDIMMPNTLLRYGATDWLEVRVVSEFASRQRIIDGERIYRHEGMKDLQAGFKLQLFQQEGHKTEIALLSHAILPTGADGFSLNGIASINRIIVSHRFNDKLSLGSNLGYDLYNQYDQLGFYTLIFAVAVNDRTSFFVEPYGTVDMDATEETTLNTDAGFTFLLAPNAQIDFSFGTGINNTMNFIGLGFSWRAVREKD